MKFTDYLAIYASIISTSVFVWNVLQSRPRIRVDLLPGIEDGDATAQAGVFIFVRNVSSHPVNLSAIELMYPFTKVRLRTRAMQLWKYRRLPKRWDWVHISLAHHSIDGGCPIRLEPRSSHRVFLADDTIAGILRDATEPRLIACVQDQLWNDVYSRTLEWDSPRASDA